ncbi:MAG: hypothetical protein JWP97_5828 [Labilithrix sp.]|nr:hypothetical protein [Labilithrix sp.]
MIGARVVGLPLDPLDRPEHEQLLTQRYLVWDRFVAGKPRVSASPLVLSPALHAEAQAVALEAAALVLRAGDAAAADEAERARYRLHPDVERLAAAARHGGDTTSLARVDLLLREDGRLVGCEVNADCPGGHNETLALPRLARLGGFAHGTDPTDVALRLADRLVALSGGPGSPRGLVGLVCATSWAEDLQVCALVERLVKERGGRARRMPVTGPCAAPGGVAYRGDRVAVLYRFYPLEHMAGQSNIEALAVATERGELASVSSFAMIHAQSKLAMARAFAREPVRAAQVFAETRAFAACAKGELLEPGAREEWVLKRDLSRVGEHVVVGALETEGSYRAAVAAIGEAESEGEVWVAQRYVPPAFVGTPWGPRCLTLGVYVMDGVFAGYFARLSSASHCGHDGLVVPVFVDAAEPHARQVA